MKVLLWLLLLLLLLGLAVVAVGWIMSNRFLVPRPYSLMPEFEIVAVEAEADGSEEGAERGRSPAEDSSTDAAVSEPPAYLVTLPLAEDPEQFEDVTKEGIYNLLWDGGYGRLGPVLERREGRVVRRVGGVVGEAPEAGDPARLDVAVFRRDPLEDHGIDYEELELVGEAGSLYAWWIPRNPSRAVLALHGRRRADRGETLRIIPTLVSADWSVMSLAYRNHDRSDPSPDRYFHYGQTEAEDALVAIEELRRRGIEEVVLYGFSMGGAVALETWERWPEDGPELLGIVMDSPLVDPRTVITHVAATGSPPVPGPVSRVALALGGLRAGIDWQELDQRRIAELIDVPVLLIAGTDDDTIPISLVDDFAARVRSPLDYLRLDGVDHVEGWNREREAYESAVEGFLRRIERTAPTS